MNRRNYIAMIGGVTGLGTAVGTGAFSTVEADRDVSVSVADENKAYLGMEPLNTPNGNQFATQGSGNQIGLDFSDSGNDGSGVGLDSVYNFDDVFQITNQGTQGVYVWATFSGRDGGTDFPVGNSDTDVWLYANGDSGDKLRDHSDDVLYLSPGGSANIGVHVDTDELDSTDEQSLTMAVRADVNNPASGDVVSGGGTVIDGPITGLESYWPLDEITSDTVADEVGTNDGTLNGGPSLITEDGRTGLSFDDSGDQYIEVGIGSTFGHENFTVAAWARAGGGSQGLRTIVARQNMTGKNKKRTFIIWFDDHDSYFGADVLTSRTTDSDGSPPTVTADDETYTDDDWHHVVMTVADDDEITLYVDGSNKASEPLSSGPYTGQAKTWIGGEPGRNRPLDGEVSDLRIYTRTLSQSEVTDLYNATD